jgi:hypothetical protein
MNQLSNIVVDFARYRRANGAAHGLTAPDLSGPLTCRWRRDAATGRLHLRVGHTEGRPRSAASLATISCSLKDLKHEQPPE